MFPTGFCNAAFRRQAVENKVNFILSRVSLSTLLHFDHLLYARRPWVLRGIVEGIAEEARTRGFPSPPLDGFGFVDFCCRFFNAPSRWKEPDC